MYTQTERQAADSFTEVMPETIEEKPQNQASPLEFWSEEFKRPQNNTGHCYCSSLPPRT